MVVSTALVCCKDASAGEILTGYGMPDLGISVDRAFVCSGTSGAGVS